ncbi:hypothetical protein JCM10207_002773 [Rhodosporidiobolus poonsookiae]
MHRAVTRARTLRTCTRAVSSPPCRCQSTQRQHLTDSEAQAFADLLGEILPRSSAAASSSSKPGSGIFDILTARPDTNARLEAGIGKVQEALRRKVGKRADLGMGLDERGGRVSRKARDQLTEHDELVLDGLKEELHALKSDRDVLVWAMRNVFGFPPQSGDVFPDPAQLAPSTTQPRTSPADADADAPSTGPASRIYPNLLHLTFLTLRDVHSSPLSALALFNLAASNAQSYISGCTTQLYAEVLRTRWDQGDVEGVLAGLEEMRGAGLRVDEKVKELVRAIGDAVRVDGERAEMWVDWAAEQKLREEELAAPARPASSTAPAPEAAPEAEAAAEFEAAAELEAVPESEAPAEDALPAVEDPAGETAALSAEGGDALALASSSPSSAPSPSPARAPPSGYERDLQIDSRRFFSPSQRAAWAKMERIVEETNDEVEAARREKEAERREAEQRVEDEALRREEGSAGEESEWGFGALLAGSQQRRARKAHSPYDDEPGEGYSRPRSGLRSEGRRGGLGGFGGRDRGRRPERAPREAAPWWQQ